MKNIVAIALGGSLGALARYLVCKLMYGSCSVDAIFPWSTLFINLSGAFIVGFLVSLFDVVAMSSVIKNFVIVGFLGAYTTLAAYLVEIITMFQRGNVSLAFFYIVVVNGVGIILTICGITVGKILVRFL